MATIVSIAPYPFLPARVGGQKAVALFYKYISRHFRLVCITTRKNEVAAAEGYAVLNQLSNSPLRYVNPFYIFLIRRIIRREKATHLILEHPYYGWLGVMLKWVCPVKLVIRSHNIEGLRWKAMGKWWWRILLGYEKWTHRMADYSLFIQDEDRQYAIDHFSLSPDRCITMTYGLEKDHLPAADDIQHCQERVRQAHGISADKTILFFNGAFSYKPNLEALHAILERVNPLLLERRAFPYTILICGKDIPEAVTRGDHPNVIFAGFVEDIDMYFKGTDIFLNAITEGGGIKTKLVEALGNNLTAISMRKGAIGVDPAWCGDKLWICENGDWAAFTRLIEEAREIRSDIPPVYFEHFYWGSIARKAADFIAGGARG